MSRRRTWLSLGCFVALMVLSPAAAQATDLLGVYRLAQTNDPTYAAARHTLDAALQQVPQARAGLLPKLDLTGNYNQTDANASFTGIPINNRNVYAWTWTLQLTQPLLRISNVYAYQEAEAKALQASEVFEAARQDLILRVAQAYFDVLVAQEGVYAAQAQLDAMREQHKQAQHGFKSGLVAVTDVYEAKAKAARAQSELDGAQNDLAAKRAELDRLTGVSPGRLAALRRIVVMPQPKPDALEPWVAQASEDNPAVLAQRAALRAASSDVGKNRAENLPTLDLTASYGGNYSSGSILNPTNFSTRADASVVGLQLTIPVYAGGAIDSQVAQARANEYKARSQLEEARRKAAAEAKEAYLAIGTGVSQIEALQTSVEAGRESVKGNRIGYKLGIRIDSDVLSAEDQLYAARRDLAKARYDTLLQGLKLKAAAGVLGVSDLATINALLEE